MPHPLRYMGYQLDHRVMSGHATHAVTEHPHLRDKKILDCRPFCLAFPVTQLARNAGISKITMAREDKVTVRKRIYATAPVRTRVRYVKPPSKVSDTWDSMTFVRKGRVRPRPSAPRSHIAEHGDPLKLPIRHGRVNLAP